MTTHTGEHHIISFGKLIAVWAALLFLTAVTILVTRFDLGGLKVICALTVACTKAGLVIAFFMHMKYEYRLLQILLIVALVTLAIFIGLTFFDVLYR
ncbi:MAG: cytochrome C oxidase subunit IV family protein [Desulfuromonadales bacterium]